MNNQNDKQEERTHATPPQKQVGSWQLGLAMALVGFTAGLFGGMSESPVATALVGGIFGLIGGGGIVGMILDARKGHRRGKLEDAARIPTDLRPAGNAISLLCVFCIAGVFAGIAFRQGGLEIRAPGAGEKGQLIRIAEAAKDASRSEQLKLVILQSELHNLGVPIKENNHFVQSYIDATRNDYPEAIREDESLRNFKRAAIDAVKAVDGAIAAITVAIDDNKSDEEKRRLKTVEEIKYGDVQDAHKYLLVAQRLTTQSQDTLEHSTAPELSVLLDLISSYREANLNQPAAGRASPLVRRSRFADEDEKRRLSIKP